MSKGKIYLIPTNIGDGAVYDEMPIFNQSVIRELDYFIVENTRSARRFLSRAEIGKPIDTLEFVELNEHSRPEDIEPILQPVLNGRSAGVLSEAGLPAIADPGADFVAAAQSHNIECIPLVGPSSIFMALMASGMNGQSFAFNGYLPVKNPDRANEIRRFERRALSEAQSQIFIEAPYRNEKLYADFTGTLSPNTRLTVAVDILTQTQEIRTQTIAQWRNTPTPKLNKRPAIFIIGGNRYR